MKRVIGALSFGCVFSLMVLLIPASCAQPARADKTTGAWKVIDRGPDKAEIEVHRVVDTDHGVICYVSTVSGPGISCVRKGS